MSEVNDALRALKFRADELIKASQEQTEHAQRLREEIARIERKIAEHVPVPSLSRRHGSR